MVTTNISSRAPMSRERLTGSGTGAASREVSVWKKGSIVSLKMKNFLVYKDAKAVFGPRLNMVVGPNGSGKSTLVCAIALGLGGSPKVLGRADNLSAFVMHGVKEDASVTVELYMPDGNNLHVTRTFSRKNNSSNWHINGRSHSTKEVDNKIRALGIQVDNLCTMLPQASDACMTPRRQDKVGDFSGFTPDKLLLETEKALSGTELYDPHMKLIDLQDSKGKSQNEEETMRTKLEGMESELSTLEKDVQRYQERQEKQNRLELHRKRKVWAGVETLRNQGIEAKQLEKDAVVELKMAQQADQPLQDEYKKWERQQERLRGAEKARVKRRTDLGKAIGDKNDKIVK
ncbi:unnamed protein product [Ectocarpus sp. 8 AP-2014]